MKKIKLIMENFIKQGGDVEKIGKYLSTLNYMDAAYAEAFLIDAYGEEKMMIYDRKRFEYLKK